jgi:hypothetical protein
MALTPAHSTSPTYFVLSDSHAKFVPRSIVNPTYQLVVKSVSGLKWFDPRNHELSAFAVLQTPSISSHIQSAAAVMLLIGTNSTRSFVASEIIHQVQSFIPLLRDLHPHLTDPRSIVVVATFPCRKASFTFPCRKASFTFPCRKASFTFPCRKASFTFPCRKASFTFPTPSLLRDNIHHYNEQLLVLTQRLQFTLVNFEVTENHLSHDNIHLHHHHTDLVHRSICAYFDQVSRPPSPPPPPKVHLRSKEAVSRRNRRRHEKLTQLQHQFFITRAVESPWTLQHVKQFLREHLIRFAKLPPIYRNQLRIQFNNPIDLQTADALLPHNVFSATQFPTERQP